MITGLNYRRITVLPYLVTVFIYFALSSLLLEPKPAVGATAADGWVRIVIVNDEFDSAVSFLKSSIEEEGLTIANEGDVADMMSRTKNVVDEPVTVYEKAHIFQFCSAKLGFKLFAAAPETLAACPLTIFAYELKGKAGNVYIGYRRPPKTTNERVDAAFNEVEALLARIVKRATE
jgi:uncharacterized protein (DUF302 family)